MRRKITRQEGTRMWQKLGLERERKAHLNELWAELTGLAELAWCNTPSEDFDGNSVLSS